MVFSCTPLEGETHWTDCCLELLKGSKALHALISDLESPELKIERVSCSVICNSLQAHGLCPPGSSVHGILQARILEWVVRTSSKGSSLPRDWTPVSYIYCFGRQVLYHCTAREAHEHLVDIYWNETVVKSSMHKYWIQTIVRWEFPNKRLSDAKERVMPRVSEKPGFDIC